MARRTYKKEHDQVEIKAACPRCGSTKIAEIVGVQPMQRPLDYHVAGKYLGKRVATKRVLCGCGQHYRIIVIEPAAEAEQAQ